MLALLALAVLGFHVSPHAMAVDHVIQISVDGLRSGDPTQNLQTLINAGQAPNFARLQQQGAWTHNARTDTTFIYTLPNHTGMMTGRPVDDRIAGDGTGHQYKYNTDPEDDPVPNDNLHENARVFNLTRPNFYVASTFDVAHDNGRRTALYHGKDKFILFKNSWNDAGAPDVTGVNNGSSKIDRYVFTEDTAALVTDLVTDLGGPSRPNYAFLHLRNTDSEGHAHGWGSPQYIDAIKLVDGQVGRILTAIDADPMLAGKTSVIVSADHGGGGATDTNHGNPASALDYTIPFYVLGPGATPGADLYAINSDSRADPQGLNVPYAALDQPIRNSDGGNLALQLLGLGTIPSSTINASQDLAIPEPSSALAGLAFAFGAAASRRRRRVTGRGR